MDGILRFTNEIDEIYNLITKKLYNDETELEINISEKNEKESLRILQYIFPKIYFKKLESNKYKVFILEYINKKIDNEKIIEKIMSIDYIR